MESPHQSQKAEGKRSDMRRLDNDKKFRAHWEKHPGRNPRHSEHTSGSRFIEKSRWVPHIGKKEIARYSEGRKL